MLTSFGYASSFAHDTSRQMGFAMIVAASLIVAPWAALAALFRQVTGEVKNRELAFALERSQLEGQALDARLRVLQGQVEPHFLFNTLANVRELVDSGSPQASAVLESLIAYLRAAVPRLGATNEATLAQELELVRAYLAVMQMRIPDRLSFLVNADPSLEPLPFPAMSTAVLPPTEESTIASSVVGSCTKRTPRIQQAETKPARSPTTPPPSASTVTSRLAPASARACMASPKRYRVFSCSPAGMTKVLTCLPASDWQTRSR